jgi:uncharacterized membrane protein
VGWPPVVRLPAVLLPTLVLALLAAPRERWRRVAELGDADWRPTRRQVVTAALIVGALLFWYVLTRFRSGQINAVDFTIYYDRPCYQTVHGRPLFVEVSDSLGHSGRSELADHAYWGMLIVCAPYAVLPTPLWLHALSAVAIVAGALHVFRILMRLGAGGALAVATALVFVLNDNTARTLNYGFHPEVLYAWFLPWLIDAALGRARVSFVLAALATVLVKEDAVLPLFAASVALALTRFREMDAKERILYLVFPPALALANLCVYYNRVVPLLTTDGRVAYAHFWGNWGQTPMAALLAMMAHPGRLLGRSVSQGLLRALQPHLIALPLVGWRWALGLLPIVALYGASANDQVRAFGIYYAIVLMPFLVIAGSVGAWTLAQRLTTNPAHARLGAAAVVLLGAILVGSGSRGYSLRPWRAELAAVPEAVQRLAGEPVVLVQSGLFTHAGYDERFKLLTPETLSDRRNAGAVLLLAARIGAYPFSWNELAHFREWPVVQPMPGGLVAVRLKPGEVIVRPAETGKKPRPWRHRRGGRRR